MNIHCYGVEANEQAFSSYLSSSWILKCNMMVAAFMGIKISLWCIKVYMIASSALT